MDLECEVGGELLFYFRVFFGVHVMFFRLIPGVSVDSNCTRNEIVVCQWLSKEKKNLNAGSSEGRRI